MLSTVVNIVPREFAGISECLLQHFLCKLVVMFVLERLVVEAYGLVELSAEMVNEAKGEVSLRVRRVETDALLEVANGFLVVPELATGVCEVCQYSLHNPVACVWLAQHECLIVVSLGLLVEFLLVVDNSEFRVNERIGRVYLLGLEQRQCGGFQIVGSQILHAHVEMRLCTAWEETHDSAINGHGLVGLVLNCKGMRHSNPCEHERLVQHYGLLEILASDLELFAVEVVSADCEPTYWMGRVALHQVVRAVVQFASEAQVEEACSIYWQDLEAQRVLFDCFKAQLVSCRDLVVLVKSVSSDAQDVNVVLGNQRLEQVLFPYFFLQHGSWLGSVLDVLDLGEVDLLKPQVLRGEVDPSQQLLLLHPRDELAVHKPTEGLHVSVILVDALLILFDCHLLVLLRLVTLSAQGGPAGLHLAVEIGVVQLQLQHAETLVILLVQQQRAGSQQLETDVVGEQFVVLEEGMHLLEVAIAEVALAQQINTGQIVVRQSHQLVTKEDGVGVTVHIQVVNCHLVQPTQTLVPQDLRGEAVQLHEVVLGMTPIVRLQDLCEEENSVQFGRGEDSGLLAAWEPLHQFKLFVSEDSSYAHIHQLCIGILGFNNLIWCLCALLIGLCANFGDKEEGSSQLVIFKQQSMSEVQQTLNRMQTHKNVQGIVIVNSQGAIIRSTYLNEKKEEGNSLARLIPQLVSKAKNTIRDLDPSNDLKFIRLKTTKYEILIAPDAQFILIVVQGQKNDAKEEEDL